MLDINLFNYTINTVTTWLNRPCKKRGMEIMCVNYIINHYVQFYWLINAHCYFSIYFNPSSFITLRQVVEKLMDSDQKKL